VEEVAPRKPQLRTVTPDREPPPLVMAAAPEPPQPQASIPQPQIIVQHPGLSEHVVAAFAALGYAVSARMILVIALLGAFALATTSIFVGGVLPLLVLIAYGCLVVLPVVWLEAFGKRPKDL